MHHIKAFQEFIRETISQSPWSQEYWVGERIEEITEYISHQLYYICLNMERDSSPKLSDPYDRFIFYAVMDEDSEMMIEALKMKQQNMISQEANAQLNEYERQVKQQTNP